MAAWLDGEQGIPPTLAGLLGENEFARNKERAADEPIKFRALSEAWLYITLKGLGIPINGEEEVYKKTVDLIAS